MQYFIAKNNYSYDLQFTKVRDVKSPTRGTEKSAGIDFYIPQFDDKLVGDLINKNPSLFSVPHTRWTYKVSVPAFNLPKTSDRKGLILMPHERILIPSGIHVKIPSGFALIAFNKSGVASKKGLDILACVVDEDYQGEIHLNVVNTSHTESVDIVAGEKLVQFILLPILYAKLQEIKTLEELYPHTTERGTGGFGSTGV